jgi:hypothetical protein
MYDIIPLDVSPRCYAFAPNGRMLTIGCRGQEKLNEKGSVEGGGTSAVMLLELPDRGKKGKK